MSIAKRILSAVFVAALAFGSVACGGDEADTGTDVEETVEDATAPAGDMETSTEMEMEEDTAAEDGS